MKRIQISLLLSVVLIATGCPKPKYAPSINFDDPTSLVKKINQHIEAERRRYEDAMNETPSNTDKAMRIRNELIENAIPYIDGAYTSFITDIQAGRDRNNFALDLVELGTAAAVGITNGERALQVIGVGLTAFRGGRRSLDANFYKDQSTPILISKMDGNRAKVRARILDSETKPPGAYALGTAVADLVDYYNAGTLVRAFSQLQQDTAVITQGAEDDLATLKKNAGIKGVVPADVLAASNEFSGAIRNLLTAYLTAKTGITTAQGTINTKIGAIATAEAAISQADQDIGTADGQITSAANATARAQAEARKATAVAAKATAEKDKTQATSDKQAAETAKADATKARDQALDKLRGIFEAISNNPRLSPLLSKGIEEDTDLTETGKATLRAMLGRLRQKPTPATDADKDIVMKEYGRVLLKFQGTIAETADPELLKALRDILNANK